MTRIEWINLLGLLAAAIAGAAYIGHLQGRLDTINPGKILERIETARADALGEIAEANKHLSGLGDLHTETYEWRQGEAPVQMIRVNEGICYLVYVRGKFEGYGEVVSIENTGDYWYLGGRSEQVDVAAKARCWKFPVLQTDKRQD